jgi:hypothetical protein
MKRTILAAIVGMTFGLGVPSDMEAQWTYVVSDKNNNDWSVKKSSARQEGDIVTIWVQKKYTGSVDALFPISEFLYEFNCRRLERRRPRGLSYRQQGGTLELNPQNDWSSVVDGTVEEDLIEIACKPPDVGFAERAATARSGLSKVEDRAGESPSLSETMRWLVEAVELHGGEDSYSHTVLEPVSSCTFKLYDIAPTRRRDPASEYRTYTFTVELSGVSTDLSHIAEKKTRMVVLNAVPGRRSAIKQGELSRGNVYLEFREEGFAERALRALLHAARICAKREPF